ncbi:MAG: ribbon-helix-helix domain-containing protein [Actinomycetota bacterium]|nr:ribbon-helix-helix domain-containing protein [Actinomycetota bacterium]
MTTKVTVNLPDDVVGALDKLATKRGITKTEALRQAIVNEKFFQETHESGNEVLIRDTKKDVVSRVIFR